MFNRERFHNQLALNLGYERLLNDNRYEIRIIDADDDISICIMWQGKQIVINSQDNEELLNLDATPELMIIKNAVHQAYIDAQKPY